MARPVANSHFNVTCLRIKYGQFFPLRYISFIEYKRIGDDQEIKAEKGRETKRVMFGLSMYEVYIDGSWYEPLMKQTLCKI